MYYTEANFREVKIIFCNETMILRGHLVDILNEN